MIHAVKAAVPCAVILLLAGNAVMRDAARAEEQKPYTIENGRVDAATAKGYQVYTENCQRCHNPDGVGRDYPYTPSLVKLLQTISETQFKQIVSNGHQCGEPQVMPAFAENPAVVLRLNELYAYLKARSDGALGPGKPKQIGDQ
jgi:mono/diheme cytochrome c family protein